MEITDVRIKLVNDSTERLKAFCSITFEEEFVVRDVKLVEGTNGLFVAMPSRKLSTPCRKCRHKNPLQARYCNECGAQLPSQKVPTDEGGRLKLYRDVAHPITVAFRQTLQDRVVEAYEAEQERASDHEYVAVSDEATDTFGTLDEAKEPSEYDSIIADLRTGTERSRRTEEPASQTEEPVAEIDVREADRDGTQRDEQGQSPEGTKRRRRGRRRGRKPAEDREVAETPAPHPPDSPAVATAPDEASDELGFGVVDILESLEEVTMAPSPSADSQSEPDQTALSEVVELPPDPVDPNEDTIAPSPSTDSQSEPDPVALSEVVEQPPAPVDPGEDTTAFGAGIL